MIWTNSITCEFTTQMISTNKSRHLGKLSQIIFCKSSQTPNIAHVHYLAQLWLNVCTDMKMTIQCHVWISHVWQLASSHSILIPLPSPPCHQPLRRRNAVHHRRLVRRFGNACWKPAQSGRRSWNWPYRGKTAPGVHPAGKTAPWW